MNVMTMPPNMALKAGATKGILVEGLSKTYGKGDTAVHALKDVNMQVGTGEVVGLVGPSGSGKSTLLKCLGAVIDPVVKQTTPDTRTTIALKPYVHGTSVEPAELTAVETPSGAATTVPRPFSTR